MFNHKRAGHSNRNRAKEYGNQWQGLIVTALHFFVKLNIHYGNYINVWRDVEFGIEMLSCEMLHKFSCISF